jgi:hypothetical protein
MGTGTRFERPATGRSYGNPSVGMAYGFQAIPARYRSPGTAIAIALVDWCEDRGRNLGPCHRVAALH